MDIVSEKERGIGESKGKEEEGEGEGERGREEVGGRECVLQVAEDDMSDHMHQDGGTLPCSLFSADISFH